MEKEELFFYKKNVPYVVGVRMYIGDYTGKALNDNNPYVVVKESEHRDFKRANMRSIQDGLIIMTKEPEWDSVTPNAISDETAAEVVKNIFALKKLLKELTSDIPVRKLLVEAESQKRPKATVKVIKDRLTELTGEDDDEEESPEQMQGVY